MLVVLALVIATFAVAVVAGHKANARTVNDPPRLVTVTTPAPVVGARAAVVRRRKPAALAGLAVSNRVPGLAALPIVRKPVVTRHVTPTVTHTYTQPPTHTTPATQPKVTVG